MGIFNIFIKKDNKFLELLNRQVEKLVEASDVLVEFMKSSDDFERRALSEKIKFIETAGDGFFDKIFDELNETFITPFDREDIQELATKMDDVLDYINGITKRTMIYHLSEIPEEFVTIAEIVQKQCRSLDISMSGLGKVAKKPEAVKRECLTIHELETLADEIYSSYVARLFAECKDPIELIKLNTIVQYLEDTTDKTEDVADVIKTIIVKYN